MEKINNGILEEDMELLIIDDININIEFLNDDNFSSSNLVIPPNLMNYVLETTSSHPNVDSK